MDIGWIVSRIQENVDVIRAVPETIFVLLIIAFSVIWMVFRTRIAGKNTTIETKQARIELYQQERQSLMSEENITRVTLDPKNPSKGKTDWKRVDAMTDEEVHQMALADPDTQPLSAEELDRFRRVPNTKAIRERLNLSQKQFARRYRIPLRTLQQWEQGRMSSVKAGLNTMNEFDGYLILPVDTVGILEETIRNMLQVAEEQFPQAIRPTFNDRPGQVAWISASTAEKIEQLDLKDKAVRLDEILTPLQTLLPVQDQAISNNINTPEEWDEIKGTF